MGAGHAHALYVHEHTRVHHLAPEVKVAATFLFVLAVAVTPREALWAFAVDAAVLAGVVSASRLPLRFVLTRLSVVLPFVAFAFLIPFVAGGERATVLGLEVSREGLWGAANILTKAVLGAGASIVLAATTEQARILKGMERLRVPRALTTIAAFMLRYLELLAGELRRMRIAMTARGYDPRWVWQVRPLATGAGALFIRSYERAERIHTAMLSRGFTGRMPDLDVHRARRSEWVLGATVPAVAAAAAATSLLMGA